MIYVIVPPPYTGVLQCPQPVRYLHYRQCLLFRAVFRHFLRFLNRDICFGETDFTCILVCSTVKISLNQTKYGEGMPTVVN